MNKPIPKTTVIDIANHEFVIPIKKIKTPEDMLLWENSIAYQEYMGFVLAINEAVKGKSLKHGEEPQGVIKNLVKMLDKLDKLIDTTPPIEQPQRFGNQAFRQWHEKVEKDSFDLVREVIPDSHHRCLGEVTSYLLESFGNPTRIDYGTGHEIAFIMFLYCLFKIEVLISDAEKMQVATRVFNRYMDLVRKLQQTYRMEPAGSHGVWSLDDYQFIPFIWGSSQLIGHPKFEPCSFLQPNIVDNFSDEYMFFACIKYINSVKRGPFAEHSNQLWGISGVASWQKINAGLVKMYKAEVLGKFPVVQHILYGSLLALDPFVRPHSDVQDFLGMRGQSEEIHKQLTNTHL